MEICTQRRQPARTSLLDPGLPGGRQVVARGVRHDRVPDRVRQVGQVPRVVGQAHRYLPPRAQRDRLGALAGRAPPERCSREREAKGGTAAARRLLLSSAHQTSTCSVPCSLQPLLTPSTPSTVPEHPQH